MTLCPGLPGWVGTRRINRSGFCWSRDDGVAVASAEPYANYLNFAPEDNHASTSSLKIFTGWMLFLTSNEQCLSTGGKSTEVISSNRIVASFLSCWCDFRQGKASVRLTDDFRRLGGLMLKNISVLQVNSSVLWFIHVLFSCIAFSVLTLLEDDPARKKRDEVLAWFICLEQGANDLHMVQLMPLPLHHLCFSKTQNGLVFWYRLTQGHYSSVVMAYVNVLLTSWVNWHSGLSIRKNIWNL